MTTEIPSLVDLCVKTAIDNVRYLRDVGDTDSQFLERILPHCTLKQLKVIEDSTKERDLSPITNGLWKKFFEGQFGTKDIDLNLVEGMKDEKVNFSWKQLYDAKIKDEEEKEQRLSARMRERYKIEKDKKQNRQIQMCNKIPPSKGRKRCFSGEPLSTFSSNIMKKEKLEFVNRIEVKNLAAMKMAQRTHGVSRRRLKSYKILS